MKEVIWQMNVTKIKEQIYQWKVEEEKTGIMKDKDMKEIQYKD